MNPKGEWRSRSASRMQTYCLCPTLFTFSNALFGRRPKELVWSIVTESYQQAFQWEPQIKGWSRAKKEALIRGDIEGIYKIVKAERKRREQNKNKLSR